jgi:hypothetical protein
LTEFPGGHELPEFLVNRIRALVKHGGENLIRIAVGSEQLEASALSTEMGFSTRTCKPAFSAAIPKEVWA